MIRVLVLVLLSMSPAVATQFGVATKKLLVTNPPSGNRRIVFKATGADIACDDPVVAPQQYGATFRLELTPGGGQCFNLPASGWTLKSTVSGLVFKYKDRDAANGPVKKAILKISNCLSTFIVVAKHTSTTPITVVPGDPTLTYGTNWAAHFSGLDRNEFCSSTGTAAPKKNDQRKFLVANDDGTTCTAVACGSPGGAFLDPAGVW